MIGDKQSVSDTDDRKLESALGMVIGHTRRNCARFAREAIGTSETTQTDPDSVTGEVDDAARLEIASVKTWVHEEDLSKSLALRSPQPNEDIEANSKVNRVIDKVLS